ncbi:MarR family winged helix-turn-helix transcriptional regulator [Phytomonospora endophytica]|uniref:DNA-binding MarR family transcriptional regulator n=1 Tax=Phytomonospora endophytica TaxID=714109 RepID=A0A841FNV4_9ACTN|nr:MarR family transcriptional regulator [Phytomonospora endophytica]MBB6034269.1 DNA-binding MarR family transcriptional regulator [Phytomonospora endophytica]GIG66662.1 MarR family transcriptional regulator [Phytomonospora endophytica]
MDSTDDTPPASLRRLSSWLVSQTAAQAQRIINERLATAGARRYHYSVLSALAEYGAMSQAALGRHCHLDRSDVAALVAELGGQGRIDREPDPADRRRNIVTITAAGERFLAELAALVAEGQDELLAPLDAGEREQLSGLLGRVVTHHAEQRGYGW